MTKLNTPKVRPVLITAPASRSGKDFVADYLVEYFTTTPEFQGYYVVANKFKFATKLKQVVHELFAHQGVKSDEVYEKVGMMRKAKLKGLGDVDVVDVWISVGEHLRGIDPTVWANQLVREVRADMAARARYEVKQATWENGMKKSLPVLYVPVISDWRMEFECTYVTEKLGTPLTLCVTSDTGYKREADGRIPDEQIQTTLVNCKTPTFKTLLDDWISTKFVQALAH